MRKLKLFLDAKAANTPPRGISKASRVIFSVLTLLFLSIGQVWGADVMYPDGTNFTTAWSKSSRTAKQTYASKTALQMMGKNQGVYGEIISESSYSSISGVSVNCTANKAVDLKLYYSADKTDWTVLSTTNIPKNQTSYTDYDLTITGIPSTAVYLKLESQANSIYMYSVTVSTGSTPTCATPTFSPAAGAVVSGTEVSISCATDGATIHYTTDGSDPTASSATAQPISITSATNIKAIAVKDGMNNSSVASASYTIATPLASMEEIFAASATAGNYYITFNSNWVVTGVSSNGQNVYITDGTKGMILYNNGGNIGLAAGNTLSGTKQCSLTRYGGAAEISNFSIAGLTKGTGTLPAVQELSEEEVAALSAVNTGALIKVSGEYTAAGYVGGAKLYNAIMALPNMTVGSTYECTGVYIYYKKNNTTDAVNEIAPRTTDDIKEVQPATLTEVNGLAELKAAELGSYYVNLTNAIVTYADDKNVFIEETNAGSLIYYQNGGHGLVKGDCLNGKYEVNTTTYNGKFEITSITAQTGAEKTTAAIPVTTLTIAQLSADFAAYESMRIKVVGANVTDAISGSDRNGAINDGAALAVYASVANTITLAENTVVNIIGYPGFHNTDEQLTVWAQDDIEDVTPAPKYTVRLWNTTDWGGTINAHVWNNAGNITEWPGEATTFAAGWNTFEVEEGNSLLFCKADGTAQTVDITEVTADACYVLTGEADGSGHLEVALDTECADRFYVAGNTELTGENWNAAGARLQNGSVTFTNVPAGDHEFKVTNGSWNWERGTAAFDSENSNVTNWGENNVGFTTYGAKDITIAYDEANNKITVQAEDYVAPAEPESRAIVVAYGDKYYAMTTNLNNKGFTPLEVTIDGEGNVVVNSEEERSSILWKFTESNGTAMFQDAEDKYLAHTGTGTDLMLQAADQENPEVWTWDSENGCYYVAVTKDNKTTNRSFFYQENANKFKNYGIETNLGKNGYSGAPVFYAADKVLVSTTAKLRFFAPVAWENVIARKWEGGEVDHVMTAVEEGSRWFECDMEKGVPFLVYNGSWDGLNQTEDIAAIDADKCFAWSGVSANGKYNVAEITSCEMSYYIAGDEVLTGVAEWGHATLVNNTVTYNQVPAAEEYKFKITNGTWDWNIGAAYVDAEACSGVTIKAADESGNVVFSLADESNVTITYNPATEKISIVADVPTPKEYYTKVTSTEDITAGTYLIVCEDYNVAYNGATTELNNTGNSIEVTIDNGKIEVSAATDAAAFFIDPAIGTIKSASGKYIGSYRASNEVAISDKIYKYPHESFTIAEGNAVLYAGTFSEKVMSLRYNSGNDVFRYYKDYGQKPIQLYKKAEAAKASPELAFNPNAVEAIKGDAFVAPTLSNEHNVTVAYEASNNKASVDAESGEVTINDKGDVTIYAVSAANDEYRESYAKYTISIKAYETVRGELMAENYYTVCYDKTMKEIRGASLWSFCGKSASMAYIQEAEAPYAAGTPYLIYAESDKLEAILEVVDEPVAGSNNGLYGTFSYLGEADLAGKGATHILKNNMLRPLGNNNHLDEYRAYVILSDIQGGEPAPAPGRRVRAIPMQQNGATGFENIEASEKPMKLMIDGKIYILRGEKMYDATGRLVK